MRSLSLLFLCSCCFVGSAFAKAGGTDPKKSQVISDLSFIKHVFDLQYAPGEWKKSCGIYDWELAKEQAIDKVQRMDGVTDEEVRVVLHKFLQSYRDYHVGALFYSAESADLPFRVQGCAGRYFIQGVRPSLLFGTAQSFEKGDEIISFDDRPVGDVIAEIQSDYCSGNHELTDRALAELFLTNRNAALGHRVPRGPVTIQFIPKGETKPTRCQVIWNYVNDSTAWLKMPKEGAAKQARDLVSSDADLVMGNRRMLPTCWAHYRRMASKLDESSGSGAQKGRLPVLGKILWETSMYNPFYAYLYETPDGHVVGCIRIPVYDGADLQVEEFGKIMGFFEKEAEAVVIDQLDNPGGTVLYMYALASTLTENAMQTPRHRLSLTEREIRIALFELPLYESIKNDEQAKRYLGNTFGYPASYQLARFYVEHLYFLIDQWSQGNSLTESTYIEGVDCINPHPCYRFTKPILMLVNELCFSGGDFLPAILQDNHRATIFGQRTAGAGGCVTTVHFPNASGLQEFGITVTLAERPDRTLLENIGVKPDVLYEITMDDLRNNYSSYITAVNENVARMLSAS